MLRRTADDDDPYERVVVANADQLAIVTALADPEPRPRLIDRCLVAAYDGGLDAAARPDQVGSGPAGQAAGDVRRARRALRRHQPRGAGGRRRRRPGARAPERAGSPRSSATPASARRPWSTPWCRRSASGRTGHVNAVTGRGRHTTTSALALPLPDGRRLGDRHPGRAVLRAAPRRPVPGHPRLPRPGSRAPRTARARAATTSRTARWTSGWRTATPTRPGCTRCAGCWPRGSGARATDVRARLRARSALLVSA